MVIKKQKKQSFFDKIQAKYLVVEVLSFPLLVHKNDLNALAKRQTTIRLFNNRKLFASLALRGSSRISGSKLSFARKLSSLLLALFVTEESLHSLINALWRVYNSNNLRLSHSFFHLINLVNLRSFKLREALPDLKEAKNAIVVRSFLKRYLTRIKSFLPFGEFIKSNSILSRIKKYNVVKNSTFHHHEGAGIFNSKDKPYDDLFFAGNGILPVLERIYEGIESNYLFYNSSSYQSVKTLYRLTNSLWKIYSGHNLELSRNFSNLINKITQEKHNSFFISNSTMTSYSSPHNVVKALKRAFFGGNLELRHSLISLFRDIRVAGERKNTSTFFKDTIFKQSQRDTVFLFCHFLRPLLRSEHFKLFHKNTSANAFKDERELLSLKSYIDKRFSEVGQSKKDINDVEALINRALKSFKAEQSEEWRFEKLKRGLF